MKLVKSLLLGSAAGLCAAAGAQAADLPMRKAAPVEYVRVCTAYGAGFFYIPGTDTCLRVGGRVRAEYQFINQRVRTSDMSGYLGLGRLNLDARTQTPYGTLRAFVRFQIAASSGGQLTSGTAQRLSQAYPAFGQDTFGKQQKRVDVDKAFIQFAGITAGRTQSFFDFYAHDLEFIANTSGSDANTNLLAYTATFGGGFSATISMEDPTWRRMTTFATSTAAQGLASTAAGQTQATNVFLGQGAITPVGATFTAAGVPITANSLSVIENNRLPDFVGVLRYDQAWGSAQVSGAVHELALGNYSAGYGVAAAGVAGQTAGTGLAAALPAGATTAKPPIDYGWAVQGGLKLNVPQLAPGDVLWLQAAYSRGANSYTDPSRSPGDQIVGATYTNRFAGYNLPGNYDQAITTDGRSHLTEAYSMTAAFLHYWSPEWRQAIFGSFARVHFDKALRGAQSPVVGLFSGGPVTAANGGAFGVFSGFGKDYNNVYAGTNLIWSPVRDLDIGVEGIYERVEFLGGASNGRVYDANKNNGSTIKVDDSVIVRMRVQRDF